MSKTRGPIKVGHTPTEGTSAHSGARHGEASSSLSLWSKKGSSCYTSTREVLCGVWSPRRDQQLVELQEQEWLLPLQSCDRILESFPAASQILEQHGISASEMKYSMALELRGQKQEEPQQKSLCSLDPLHAGGRSLLDFSLKLGATEGQGSKGKAPIASSTATASLSAVHGETEVSSKRSIATAQQQETWFRMYTDDIKKGELTQQSPEASEVLKVFQRALCLVHRAWRRCCRQQGSEC